MHFNTNIKLLRRRKGLTQDDMAVHLKMKRSTLSGYENGIARPSIPALITFSDFFKISIDTLIRIDMAKLSESNLRQIEQGYNVFMRGGKLRVMATTIDSQNKENIELVPEKAKAGYSTGFADPDYIKKLPVFQLPFLSSDKKYRTFQVSGDSMLPIPDGAWITGEFVQDWTKIKSNKAYIILTIDDGIVFKKIDNKIKERGVLIAKSLNQIYETYEISAVEIREIWKFTHYINPELPDGETAIPEIVRNLTTLRKDVDLLLKKSVNRKRKTN